MRYARGVPRGREIERLELALAQAMVENTPLICTFRCTLRYVGCNFAATGKHEGDARRFLAELHERFAKFGLELHPDKTRLIEFGGHRWCLLPLFTVG
jgi:hypothetical protein